MSNLSLLLAANPHGTNPACGAGGESERPPFAPVAWPEAGGAVRHGASADWTEEYTLPSGVASMEHWLDLNA